MRGGKQRPLDLEVADEEEWSWDTEIVEDARALKRMFLFGGMWTINCSHCSMLVYKLWGARIKLFVYFFIKGRAEYKSKVKNTFQHVIVF